LSWILSLIFFANSDYFCASSLNILPTLIDSYPKSVPKPYAIYFANDPGGPTIKTLIGSFLPSQLIRKSIGSSGL